MAITRTVLGTDVRVYSDRTVVTINPSANTLVLLFLQSTNTDPTSVSSSHGTWTDLTSSLSNDAAAYRGKIYGLITGGSPSSGDVTTLYTTSGKKAAYCVELPGAVTTSLADAVPTSNRQSRYEYIGSTAEDVTVTMNAFGSSTNATVVFSLPSLSPDTTTAAGFTDISPSGDHAKAFFLATEDNTPTVNCKVTFYPSRTFAFEIVEATGGGSFNPSWAINANVIL